MMTRARERGFTLLEMMIAVAIIAMITTLTYGAMTSTFKTKSAIEAQSGRYRTVRLAMERMARELSMAYLSQNEDTSLIERRTFFIGKSHTDIDELRFSYFGHQRLYQDAPEADSAQVLYYPQREPDKSDRQDLMRREVRRLGNVKPEDAPGESDIVCDDIISLKFRYYDLLNKTWREEWNTTSSDGQPDRLPTRVSITLTVHDERGVAVPFYTEARIMMQEPLNLKAVDSQAAAPPATPAVRPDGGTR
jgi:general secretion pathway protein J